MVLLVAFQLCPLPPTYPPFRERHATLFAFVADLSILTILSLLVCMIRARGAYRETKFLSPDVKSEP